MDSSFHPLLFIIPTIILLQLNNTTLIVSIVEISVICLFRLRPFLYSTQIHRFAEFILEKNLYDRTTMQILRKIREFHSNILSLKHDYLTFYVIASIAYPPSEKGKPKQPKNPPFTNASSLLFAPFDCAL